MSKYLIYGLIDPRTRMIRYIGLSSRGLTRPKDHRRDPKAQPRWHVSRWIAQLQDSGLDYEITVLEETSDPKLLPDLERHWIAYARASEWPLTNMTDGGDGILGLKHGEQTKIKMRNAGLKRYGSPTDPVVRLEIRRRKARERTSKWNAENPGRALARALAWSAENPNKSGEIKRRWVVNNPDKVRATNQRWRNKKKAEVE